MKSMLKFLLLTMIMLCIMMAAACIQEKDEKDKKKVKDLDFTVVEDADVPQELMDIINEKKAEPFKLTFSNTENLYIVVGYGKQPSGGYSIAVEDLYLTDNAIVIDTNLIGPSEGDLVTQAITYPYVVVKLEFIDKPAEFY